MVLVSPSASYKATWSSQKAKRIDNFPCYNPWFIF